MSNEIETKELEDIDVWDGNKFTPIETIQRHLCDDLMVKVSTENGYSFSCKRTHPSWCKLNITDETEVIISAENLLNKFVLTEQNIYSKIISVEEFEYDDFLYDLATYSKAYMGDGIRTHNSFHCSSFDSLIFIKEAGNMCCLTLNDLWSNLETEIFSINDREIKAIPIERYIEIWDYKGWVQLQELSRHKPTEKMVAVSNGESFVICQENHMMAVAPNKNVCNSCGYHNLVKPEKKAKDQTKWRCTRCWKTQEIKSYSEDDISFKEIKNIEENTNLLYKNLEVLRQTKYIIPKHDAYLVGMFITEGNCAFTTTKGKSTKDVDSKPYRVQIHQNPGPIKDKIYKKVCELFPDKYTLAHRTVTIKDKTFAHECHSLYGRYSWNKHLPPDFIHYPNEWLIDFLCAVIEGDGCITNRDGKSTGQVIIDTVSFSLLQQLQIICHKLGIVSTMLLTPNREKTDWQGYRLNIRITDYVKELLKNCYKIQFLQKPSKEQKPSLKEFRLVSYTKPVLYTREYVYDVTTSTGTFICGGLATHNSGGVAAARGGASVDRLTRLNQLLDMPKILPGAATLSRVGGELTKIEKDPVTNGHKVYIKSNGELHEHFVPSYHDVTHKEGVQIAKGDSLSTGPINPHQLVKLKGISAVREYLTNELGKMYKDVGGVRRRNVELVVKNLTNFTEIKDPGNSEHLVGDIVPLSVVENHNRQSTEKIIHAPVIRGVSEGARIKDEDVFTRMNFQQLQKTISEGASKGWKSTLSGGNSPIGPYVSGNLGKIIPERDKRPEY